MSICVLWKVVEETCHQLFIKCSYTFKVQKATFLEILNRWKMPISCKDMFTSSHRKYKGNFQNKTLPKRIWNAYLKYICWKVWLARNASIFQDQREPTQKIAIKGWGLLRDYLMNKRKTTMNAQHLDQNEKQCNR